MTAMQPTVVAFDVDGTLTVRDCVVPFMRRVAGPAVFGTRLVAGGVSNVRAVVRRDRDLLKADFVRRVFEGRDVEQVRESGVRFAAEIAESWLRADVAGRLRWHQDQGHVVLLVSASLDPYLEPLGDMLEVDAVLCTTLETDGVTYSGRLVGPNCRADQKIVRIREWCTASGVAFESLEWAYGDSSGDTAMLAAATNGVLVKGIELTQVPA